MNISYFKIYSLINLEVDTKPNIIYTAFCSNKLFCDQINDHKPSLFKSYKYKIYCCSSDLCNTKANLDAYGIEAKSSYLFYFFIFTVLVILPCFSILFGLCIRFLKQRHKTKIIKNDTLLTSQ